MEVLDATDAWEIGTQHFVCVRADISASNAFFTVRF